MRHRGFTLVELTIVMVIMGIVAITLSQFFNSHPLEAYVATNRRAELVSLADTAMNSMANDLRTALPNSVRVTGAALEFMPVSYGGRYRSASSGVAGSDPLDFSGPDASFQLFGAVPAWPSNARLVVYHTGQTGANLWAGDSVITPVTTTFSLSFAAGETKVTLSSPQWFPFASPQKRIYVVTQPISFLCDTSTGQLNRFANYSLQLVQPTSAAIAPLANASVQRVVDYVSACTFSYAAGTAQHSSVVTIDLTLTKNGESVRLLQQVHINNGA